MSKQDTDDNECPKFTQLYNDYLGSRKNDTLLTKTKTHVLACSHPYCIGTAKLIAMMFEG